MRQLTNRRTRVLSKEDIQTIVDTYHAWRTDASHGDSNGLPEYEDIPGFCASATKDRVAKLDYALTRGRYVGLALEDDDFDFTELFTSLRAEFAAQLEEEAELNERIKENLNQIELDG